jgi:hypothetical protein
VRRATVMGPASENLHISGLMRCSKLRLLVDHLVCAGEPRRGKIEAEHSSGLEVDDQLVFGRRLQCEHFKQP